LIHFYKRLSPDLNTPQTWEMAKRILNPITETYSIAHEIGKNKVFENVFDYIVSSDEARDLVLLCGEEKLSYHSEVVAAVFPFIKDFVQNSKSGPWSVYIQKRAEIFISLDGVNPDTMRQIMGCIYENKPFKFSRESLGEVRNIFRMLGVDDRLFVVEKIESKSKRPEARNGDVFRKVLGSSGTLDLNKRKISNEDEEEQIAKKRLVDISMKDEPETVKLSDQKNPEYETKSIENNSAFVESTIATVNQKDEVEEHVVSKTQPAEPINRVEITEPKQLPEAEKSDVRAEMRMVEEQVPHTPKEMAAAIISESEPKDSNLQKILPHLTVTTIKQEPQESAGSPEIPLIKQEPGEGQTQPQDSEGSSTLRCPIAICSSEIMFKTRAEILLHLTQAHYTDGLLDLYPFVKGQPCKICVDEKKPKVLIAQMKNRFVAHIGVNHEVVMDLLPAELKEVLMVLPRRMKKLSTQETSSTTKPVDVTLEEAPPSTTQSEQYPTYQGGFNYNYPVTNSYPQQAYNNQSGYPPQSYPVYTSYPPYQPPATPSYPSYPYEGSTSSQQSAGPVIKDEAPTAAVKEESKVVIKEEPLDPDTMYRCTLCTARSFGQRSDLLFHLSITHFSRNLNQMYPFKEQQVCPLCNLFTPKNMSSHISHVGLKHEQVIKFVPAELAATLTNGTSENVPIPTKPVNNVEEAPIVQPIQKVVLPVEKPVAPVESKPQPVDATIEEPTVQCELCKANNKERLFSKRSEFLKHLSLLHFGKALLAAFPFAEGRNCNLCFETSKKMYTPSKKEVHVCHVGVLHAKIFELLPKEILQTVMEMPTMKRTIVNNVDRQPSTQDQEVKKTDSASSQPTPTVPQLSTVEGPNSTMYHPPPPSTPAPPAIRDPAPPSQGFVSHPPRDVVFTLPGPSLPAKEEFKMPMTKTDKPYNCRYCVSGFDNAKDLKDHLLTHKSQFSQINQTPRKMNSSLVNLRMNTPRK